MSSSVMTPLENFFPITFLFRKYTTNSTPEGRNRNPGINFVTAIESKIKHYTTLSFCFFVFIILVYFLNLNGNLVREQRLLVFQERRV